MIGFMNEGDEYRNIVRSRSELGPVVFLELVEYLAHVVECSGNGVDSCEEEGVTTNCYFDSFFEVLVAANHVVDVLDVDSPPKVDIGIDVWMCVVQSTPDG